MRRSLRTAVLAAILACSASATIVSAQPRKPPPGADKRDDLKKRIRLMRAYSLTEELKLDEAATGRLFPVLAKYDEITDKLLAQRGELQRKLADPPVDPKAIDKLVDESIANQNALWDAQDKRLAELRKVLTPAQTARLLVVLPALERRIADQLRDAAAGKGKGGGKGGVRRNGPDDDDNNNSNLEDPFAGRPNPKDPFDDRR